MRNTEEVQRLVKQVMEEENNLVELLDKKGQFNKEREVVMNMMKRMEKLRRWIEDYERVMQEMHRRVLLAAEEEVVLYPPTVFGKSHFENLQEYQDLLLIKGKQVTQP